MSHDLPGWVAELTDPRRAQTLDELADRLVPLAEHAIDVSRRLQAQLNELNDPFKREALYGRVERLKARAGEALDEVTGEIARSGERRIERLWAERAGRARPAGGDAERAAHAARERDLRRLLDRDVVAALSERQREAAERVAERTSGALEQATRTLLTRVEELAKAVTALVHDVLPLAREGLDLAGRISALSGSARRAGRGPVPADLAGSAAEAARAFDEAVARLELEWAALGARSATVRAALRGAEEAAFSHVTEEMTRCVQDLAPEHAEALNEAEERARALFEGSARSERP
ncbi:hypothetical protein [Actinomadura sp. WAC 06369]|uniref:hypothetical protein n=1 Tax=Actinomadura sp. WAC 06369 TaxID=2203193 RepID=UPI000F798100|nr:hypothetical protein [Actinomadura sp. WAC 06369]RSN58360.1 hypothetical protein DMH08_22815 [Actinomadura sp. WAC 06369]